MKIDHAKMFWKQFGGSLQNVIDLIVSFFGKIRFMKKQNVASTSLLKSCMASSSWKLIVVELFSYLLIIMLLLINRFPISRLLLELLVLCMSSLLLEGNRRLNNY